MSASQVQSSQQTRLHPSATVIAHYSEEGTVLLNLCSGKYYSLNELGRLIWARISELGASREELLRAVAENTGEGIETVSEEVDGFLTSMRTLRLISDSAPVRRSSANPAPDRAPATDTGNARLPWWHSLAVSMVAWMGLLAFDCVARIWGFRGVCWLTEHFRILRWPASWLRNAEAVYEPVIAACIFYLKPVLCLQRAAVTTLVLRLHGWPANMIVGIHEYPFAAHAWSELDGRAITDPARVYEVYTPMARF